MVWEIRQTPLQSQVARQEKPLANGFTFPVQSTSLQVNHPAPSTSTKSIRNNLISFIYT